FNRCGHSCPIQIAGLTNRDSYLNGRSSPGLNLLQAGLIWNRGHKTTIQVGLGNLSEEAMLQVGFLNISGTSDMQMGFFNGTGGGGFLKFGFVNGELGSTDHALWIGAINFAAATEGMTLGVWNVATAHNSGLMIGMFNYAGENAGIQIGLINVDGSSLLPILPVIRF
ncbi:MAG: hypothetical protein KDK37_07175, partial [Leptospiraceae bacterium]|nr:hypothetical protein [Leptospiraceae bacterium]